MHGIPVSFGVLLGFEAVVVRADQAHAGVQEQERRGFGQEGSLGPKQYHVARAEREGSKLLG
jgi:hypothetical protein